MTKTEKRNAIRDAQIRLLQSTDRLLRDAETVKRDRDHLIDLANSESTESNAEVSNEQ